MSDESEDLLKGTLDLHGVQKEVSIPVKAEQTAEGVHDSPYRAEEADKRRDTRSGRQPRDP